MKVELVAKTQGVGKYESLTSEEIIASIARHGVIKKDNGKLVRYLMKSAHWSPLDMINFTFEVETSRAIGRQWLRHSSIKPQEHSQRYSDRVQFEDIEFRLEHPTNRQSSTKEAFKIKLTELGKVHNGICPIEYYIGSINNDFDSYALKVRSLIDSIENLYKEGLELGLAKECLRMFLPECTTSTLTFNGTLRSWLSFLNVRCDHHSQKEIQILATMIGEILEKEMPDVFSQIDWKQGTFM